MHKILIATLAAGVMAAGVAQSANTPASASFQVTANVQANCRASATTLAFGNYTPGSGPVTGNTNVTVNCTLGTPFTVALDKGTTSSGTIAQRLMAASTGTSTLQYNLYTSSGFGTIFGDGTTGGTPVTGTGAGMGTPNAVLVPVYGSLPDSAANQAVPTGSYADTIGVTVSY